MSDALTNSEIEDVLTSVRRLVADDKRRAPASEGEGRGGRLILTPSQRVDDAGRSARPADDAATEAAAPVPTPSAPAVNAMATPPDFRRLEATIAELEAAVSASGSVFEPDGTETAQPSNVTALYGKPSFQHAAPPRAEGAAPVQDTPAPAEAQAPMPAPEMRNAPQAGPMPEGEDDDTFETVIDEAMLRVLVAQIVREELQGQLGERITLQVRKLVRSEIAKALDSRNIF